MKSEKTFIEGLEAPSPLHQGLSNELGDNFQQMNQTPKIDVISLRGCPGIFSQIWWQHISESFQTLPSFFPFWADLRNIYMFFLFCDGSESVILHRVHTDLFITIYKTLFSVWKKKTNWIKKTLKFLNVFITKVFFLYDTKPLQSV